MSAGMSKASPSLVKKEGEGRWQTRAAFVLSSRLNRVQSYANARNVACASRAGKDKKKKEGKGKYGSTVSLNLMGK